jgi:hypothetical protein
MSEQRRAVYGPTAESANWIDAGWAGVVVAIGFGIAAWYYSKRSAHFGEKTYEFEIQRDKAAKLTHLELIRPREQESLWHFIGGTANQVASFSTDVRNRGPAHALDVNWAASLPGVPATVGNTPDYFMAIDDYQLVVEIPLHADLTPKHETLQVNVTLTDGEGPKQYRWCLRLVGDPKADPNTWTLQVVDCISLKPRRGTWAQPSPNQ